MAATSQGVLIVDTKCANLASVSFAFDRLCIPNKISDDPSDIRSADKVLIPGVGSAPYALAKITAAGLLPTLKSLDQPVLGICLGMQILFETLDEGGQVIDGLGLVPGHVGPLKTGNLPSPHMGWNCLSCLRDDPLTHDLEEGDHAYFVHSFAAPVTKSTIAKSHYGQDFSAIIRHKNIRGCQFHPERSARTGASILRAFATL